MTQSIALPTWIVTSLPSDVLPVSAYGVDESPQSTAIPTAQWPFTSVCETVLPCLQLCESLPPSLSELSPQLQVPLTVTSTVPELPETYFHVALVESGSPAFAAAVAAATSPIATIPSSTKACRNTRNEVPQFLSMMFLPPLTHPAPCAVGASDQAPAAGNA